MNILEKVFSLLSRTERGRVIVLAFLTVIGVILETFSVGLIIPALALMLQDNIGQRYPRVQPLLDFLGNPSQNRLLLGAMVGLVVVYAVKNSYIVFLTRMQMRFTFDLQASLSRRLFTTYLRQPYAFHLSRNSAQLINNVTGEVNILTLVVNNSIAIATETLVLIAIGSLLLAIEPVGTLIVIGVLGSAALIFHYVTRFRVSRWGVSRQYHGILLIQHLQQGLGGVKDVKLLGREAEFVRQYDLHNRANARIIGLQSIVQQLPRLWLELLAVAGMAILVQAMLVQGRDLTSIVSTVGLFAAAAFRLMPSVTRIISATQILSFNLPAVNTVYRELQLDIPDDLAARDESKCQFNQEVRFHDVTYRYPDSQLNALTGLSITIGKGECVGIIGPSGSGKSTAIDLVLGLLTPSAGTITVDGHDIQQQLRSWQNQMGYVPQSIYLTDDTLRRNIAFGIPESQIDDKAIQNALAAAQLADFVSTLPERLSTVVGERGVRLSGGQRQRIGVARALYHRPAVLVLDEATSALDTETESGVMDAVSALKGKTTIIVVAHRLSTVEHCDRIYRLEKGELAEQGTPADLGIVGS